MAEVVLAARRFVSDLEQLPEPAAHHPLPGSAAAPAFRPAAQPEREGRSGLQEYGATAHAE